MRAARSGEHAVPMKYRKYRGLESSIMSKRGTKRAAKATAKAVFAGARRLSALGTDMALQACSIGDRLPSEQIHNRIFAPDTNSEGARVT
jgi:hypothetical protein